MSPYGKPENRTFKGTIFSLRLQLSLMAEARKVAKAEGVSLNHFFNVAVAEKLSALRTEAYFQEGIRRVECAMALRILDRAGDRIPPRQARENSPHWQVSEENDKPSRS